MKAEKAEKKQALPREGKGPEAMKLGNDAKPSKNKTQDAILQGEGYRILDAAEVGRSPFNRDIFDSVDLEALTADVALRGVLQPILVRPNPGYIYGQAEIGTEYRVQTLAGTVVAGGLSLDAAKCLAFDLNAPTWEIVAGERRWRAAKAAKRELPAIVQEMEDRKALECQAVENMHRENLNPLHEAQKYRQLLEAYQSEGALNGSVIEMLCEKVGRSRSIVYERMKLLDLPETARAALVCGRLPASHAALLTKIDDPKVQAEIAARILKPKPYELPDEDELPDGRLIEKLTVMSFREAKLLVSNTVRKITEQREYAAAVEQAMAEGRKVLKPAELKKIMPWGYVNSDDYVDADATTNAYSPKPKTWRQLLGQHAPPIVVGRQRPGEGEPVDLYEKKALSAAIKAAGLKKKPSAKNPERKKSRDEIEQEQAAKLREIRWAGWLDSILEKATERTLLETVIALHAVRFSHLNETSPEEVIASLPSMQLLSMRRLALRMLMDRWTPGSWMDDWSDDLKAFAQRAAAPLPAWDVQTSGHAASETQEGGEE